MYGQTLFNKLKALIIFRAFFAALLLGTPALFNIGYYKFPYPYAIIYLLASLYLLSIIYSVLLYRVKNLAAFAYVQLSIDAVSEILLIFFTGGIESWFSFIMLLTVMAAAIILNKKAGYIMATLCGILYGLMIDLQFYRVILLDYDPAVREKDFLHNIFSHMSALYLTAYLTGYLSSRLENTSVKLREKDADLKDLAVFNRELIENLPSGLLTTDLSGKVLIFNKAAENITGMDSNRAEGMTVSEVFPFIKQPVAAGRVEGGINCSGNKKIIGLAISGTEDSSGHRTGYTCIFQDITELKRLEAELKHRDTLAAIGELSANMAHEIRNPIASLKSSIEMLKEGRLTREHSEKLMGIAISEMDRLNRVITDFLVYSRPRPPEFCWFSLNKALDETAELLRNASADAGNITVTEQFDAEDRIFADPDKLRQVFLNIGRNAVEAMPDGGNLEISTSRDKDMVSIFFRDSGSGIQTEDLKEIFYPFFTTRDKGTGLGLSIAYRIIEEHNGRIKVSSGCDGTTFEIILPVEAAGAGPLAGESENKKWMDSYGRA